MSEAVEKEVMDQEAVMEQQEVPEETPEEVIEKPYTLRSMKDRDLFPMLQILKKIGLKDFKEPFIQVISGEKTLKQVGIFTAIDMADVLICNLPKAENEIYALWADISGIPAESIKEMEFGTLPLMIVDTFKEMRNTSFFKVLAKLLS